MASADIAKLFETQSRFFQSGETRPVGNRRRHLAQLKRALKRNESELLEDLYQDLKKPTFEAYVSELGTLYEDIDFARRRVRSWARPRRVSTPLLLQPAKCYLSPEPLGVTLVIAPWNYPLQLLLSPLVAALAAGNTVMLKPSEMAPATSDAVRRMIADTFSPGLVTVVEGGVDETQSLLNQPFSHILFTGSARVGRIIMEKAAQNLTPVTLELGGKSPCIIHRDVDVEVAARRVAWGKFFNAGQTCIAPDYLLVDQKIQDEFCEALVRHIGRFYGDDPRQSPDFARIINRSHFDRLERLWQDAPLICGGEADREDLYIAPTLVGPVDKDHPTMHEEIFGPVFPVIPFDDVNEAIGVVREHPNPLAGYFFSRSPEVQSRLAHEIPFGGGCINDTLAHFQNPRLPFGGVGPSGMGVYHGKHGFDTFSHKKSLLKNGFRLDATFKYPPYSKRALSFVRRMMS